MPGCLEAGDGVDRHAVDIDHPITDRQTEFLRWRARLDLHQFHSRDRRMRSVQGGKVDPRHRGLETLGVLGFAEQNGRRSGILRADERA